jgi:DHA2 family multidrug resistance protein
MALIGLALGSLEIVLDKGQREDWFTSSFIIAFAATSAVSLILFVPWELNRNDPIVDIRLLCRRQFATSFLLMMMVGATLFSTTQLMPQLLQESFGYTAMLSGLVLMPGGIAMLLMMPIAALLTNFVQPKYLMATGMLVLATALWHFTSFPPDASFDYFAWARVFQMVGMPLLFVPITTASYAGLPPEKTNQASALINVARNLGGSIGVSAAITVVAQREQFHQFRLIEHLVPSSLQYQETLRQAAAYFVSQGASQADAHREALGWLSMLVQSQACFCPTLMFSGSSRSGSQWSFRSRSCCYARFQMANDPPTTRRAVIIVGGRAGPEGNLNSRPKLRNVADSPRA